MPLIPDILHHPYSPDTSMMDVIGNHYDLLLVITRFGIPLGFGDRSVEEVCAQHQVHTPTLLAVLNLLSTPHKKTFPNNLWEHLSAPTLIAYLQRSHHYFLEYKLPLLQTQMEEATTDGPADLVPIILDFYKQYMDEVHKHMGYEDKTVFPYVKALLANEPTKDYRIQIFSRRHDQVEAKISELKSILLKYYPTGSKYSVISFLHNLFATEADLASHNLIEDFLFIPLIAYLEQKNSPSDTGKNPVKPKRV